MKLGQGVEWGLHAATVLAALPGNGALPAGRLAEFHGVPGAYLAKQLQAMARAGIVEAVTGPGGGYRLARPADTVTMLDVVLAVEGDQPAFTCTEIRQRGPAAGPPSAYPRPCGIAVAMEAAEAAWRNELRKRTIADLLAGAVRDSKPTQTAKAVAWMEEVIR
jgi:Rrf2 family protein